VLLSSSAFAVGVKIPVQVLLSLLVIVASVPDVVPLSRLGTVMSSALEKEATGSENSSDTVALSSALSAVSERVKELTVGARVSTSKFEVVAASPGLPTVSVQLLASESVLVASSLSAGGVKVPVQVMLSLLVMVASEPLSAAPAVPAAVMSSSLVKEATASEKTSVTVALSPALSAVSERVKEFTEGARVSFFF